MTKSKTIQIQNGVARLPSDCKRLLKIIIEGKEITCEYFPNPVELDTITFEELPMDNKIKIEYEPYGKGERQERIQRPFDTHEVKSKFRICVN